ncbi:MAG: hypothetical protein QXP38_05860 [Nitrososphaerota archaeon]
MGGRRVRDKKNLIKELGEEIDVFDDMLNALVELLEEKGILTHEEWGSKNKGTLWKESQAHYL